MAKSKLHSPFSHFWNDVPFGQKIIILLFILGVLSLPIVLLQAQTKQETESQASEISAPALRDLIRNGSFETDANHDGIPDDWTWFRKDIGENNGQDCNTAQAGKCSFSIHGGDTIKTLTQDIHFKNNSNSQFIFNVWSKTRNIESNNVEVGLSFLDKHGHELGSISDVDNKGRHDFAATNPSNIPQWGIGEFETIRVFLKYKQDQDSGRVWFDNVTLRVGRPLPSPTPTPRPSCVPRPGCLDTHPACKLPTPREGWCPLPSPSPRPSRPPLGSPIPLTTHKPGIPIPSVKTSTQ